MLAHIFFFLKYYSVAAALQTLSFFCLVPPAYIYLSTDLCGKIPPHPHTPQLNQPFVQDKIKLMGVDHSLIRSIFDPNDK